MIYEDEVYGRVEISEPILLAIMQSAAVQRLHGVLQHGITSLIGLTKQITRYEHSVGAMLLVRWLGGSVEEQLGALLHDVSHTAFSHVIDHVFDNSAAQSYHDEVKEEYVASTDLPETLASFGFNWRDFIDETQFLLLEQPAPALCADRIDYFLRDTVPLGLATTAEVQNAIAHLVVQDGRIMADDLATARWMGETFMAADDASWSNFREVGLYELTAKAIRRGLEIGLITEQNFWQTDAVVWQKLCQHPDERLQKLTQLVSLDTQFVWDAQCPDFVISTKIRTIDPDVVTNGRVQPLSQLDPDFAQRRAAYLERKQGAWPMRVVGSMKRLS